MPIPQRVPGFFLAPKHGLVLRFQLNHATLRFTKQVNYELANIPGWEAPLRWWTYGGTLAIMFELFFDATDAARTTGPRMKAPGLGVRPELAVLESFLYPRATVAGPGTELSPAPLKKLASLVARYFDMPQEWTPPPMVYLVYGPRWWKGVVTQATVTEQKHDATLTPVQAVVEVRYDVHEFGDIHKIMTRERQFLALVGSAESVLTAAHPENIAAVLGAVVGTTARELGELVP
jgi:hypothetical protein